MFTKGPWLAGCDFLRDIKCKDGYLATAWWFGNKGCVSKSEAEANARLISVAPTMHDLLRRVLAGECVGKEIESVIKKVEKPLPPGGAGGPGKWMTRDEFEKWRARL